MLAPSVFELQLFGAFRPDDTAREVAAGVSLRSRERRLLFSGRPFIVGAVVDVDGIATRATAQGTLDLGRIGTSVGALRLEFCGDAGEALELSLSRRFELARPVFSFSRWQGDLWRQDGARIGALELRQDFRHRLGRYANA